MTISIIVSSTGISYEQQNYKMLSAELSSVKPMVLPAVGVCVLPVSGLSSARLTPRHRLGAFSGRPFPVAGPTVRVSVSVALRNPACSQKLSTCDAKYFNRRDHIMIIYKCIHEFKIQIVLTSK